MRNALEKLLPKSASNDEELDAMRRAAWHRQGVLMVRPEEVYDPWLRQALVNLGDARYGKRKSQTKREDKR
jgi:hypothetical protein